MFDRPPRARATRSRVLSFPSHLRTMGARALYHDPMPMGLIAVALMLGTGALFQVPVPIPLLVAGFCGTTLVYGIDRGLIASPEDQWNRPDRRRWVQRHQTWIWGEAALMLLGGAAVMPYLDSVTLFGVLGLTVLAGLHLFSFGGWGRLLQASGIGKPLAVAGGWAIGGTLLPLLESGHSIGGGAALLAGYRFLFILPNVMRADWGDRQGDAAVGRATWTPGGTLHSLRLASTGLLSLAGVGAVLAVACFTAPPLLLVDALGLILMLGAVWGLRPGQSPLHAFLLDMVVAWPVLVWLVR